MVVQTDDKILIGGDFTIVDGEHEDNIARLNSDGSLDRSFACRVGSWTYDLSFSLQSDGKIVLTGGFSSVNGIPRNGVARLLSDYEPPHLGNCRFKSGQFSFDLSGEPGRTVVIQGSTDLQHWIPIATNMLSSRPIPFSDSQNTALPERFYRLMVP
jgi:hypothetical protein